MRNFARDHKVSVGSKLQSAAGQRRGERGEAADLVGQVVNLSSLYTFYINCRISKAKISIRLFVRWICSPRSPCIFSFVFSQFIVIINIPPCLQTRFEILLFTRARGTCHAQLMYATCLLILQLYKIADSSTFIILFAQNHYQSQGGH